MPAFNKFDKLMDLIINWPFFGRMDNHSCLKSVNLQYIMLGHLDDGTNGSSTKHLMFQVLLFFMTSCKILCKNPFNLHIFLFSYKITKIKIKSFESPKSIKKYQKKYTWNIRFLVDDSFVPSSKLPSMIYLLLTDF